MSKSSTAPETYWLIAIPAELSTRQKKSPVTIGGSFFAGKLKSRSKAFPRATSCSASAAVQSSSAMPQVSVSKSSTAPETYWLIAIPAELSTRQKKSPVTIGGSFFAGKLKSRSKAFPRATSCSASAAVQSSSTMPQVSVSKSSTAPETYWLIAIPAELSTRQKKFLPSQSAGDFFHINLRRRKLARRF